MINSGNKSLKVGLALSGGGSRAIAFHLGCMRALHNLGILDKVDVISSVSGGSVINALYSYYDDPFSEFEKRIKNLLLEGLQKGILMHFFSFTGILTLLNSVAILVVQFIDKALLPQLRFILILIGKNPEIAQFSVKKKDIIEQLYSNRICKSDILKACI